MREINKIIIHCSATAEGKPFTAQHIDVWHRKRGFRCIGYHYVIHLDGTIIKGRDEAQIGAHCSGYNAHSLGVCYIGGLAADGKTPKDTRTEEQRAALIRLIKKLKQRYPHASVHGHNELTCKRVQSSANTNYAECSRECTKCEFSAKACPSFNVQNDPDLCK